MDTWLGLCFVSKLVVVASSQVAEEKSVYLSRAGISC
jgi:hypothetical protein